MVHRKTVRDFHQRRKRICYWNVPFRVAPGGLIGIEYVWIDWEYRNKVDNLLETINFRDFFRSQVFRGVAK